MAETRFVAFGCWNEDCCKPSTSVYKVLNAIKEEQDKTGPFNFSIVLGDNYYPDKKKVIINGKEKKVKTTNINNLSESFQLLTTSLFGEGSVQAAASAAREASAQEEGVAEEEVAEEEEVIAEKEIFLLLGNHDVEKTIELTNQEPGCYVTLFEKTFAQAFNRESQQNKIHFPKSKLVMFKEIGTHTLIIMIDTNIYSGENLVCYSYLGHGHTEESIKKLQESQLLQVHEILRERRFKNIIVCGHNPLIGFKNQVVKEGKSKGGLDICSEELYKFMFSLKQNGENFYYLCADIHNYQQGDVTITDLISEINEEMLIHQYIVGIGGTELDDDYDEAYNPKFPEPNPQVNQRTLEATISVSGLLNFNLKYKIQEHFSEFGYLVVTIDDDNSDVSFQVKHVPIQQVIASLGGKHTKRRNKQTKRRNKQTKRRNKRTKKTSKRRRYTKRK